MALKDVSRIIIPVDGSDSAGRAARFAAELAALLDCPATLLHAHPASSAEFLAWVGQPPVPERFLQENVDALLENMREVAAHAFARAREAIGETSAHLDERVVEGTPAEAIAHSAAEEPGSIIVMGSRGLSQIRGFLLGSVSERVLRTASCPVTIVH